MHTFPNEDRSKDERPKAEEIRHYLKESSVQADLQRRLASVTETVTTSIREAALVARMSEAQLRYSESKGLLTPKRTIQDMTLDPDTPRGQRRYSLPELRRLVVIGKLLEMYSPNDVSQFFQLHEATIQDVIETQPAPLSDRVFIAEQTVFQRFIVPRLLYFAIALLFENTIFGEAGIYIPVRDSEGELAQLAAREISESGQLGELGRSLIGWHSHRRPFTTFLNERPFLDLPGNFRIKPLRTLLANDESLRGASLPIAVHLAIEHTLEPALTQAAAAIEQRLNAARRNQQAAADGLSGATGVIASSRAVAARLLWLMQQTSHDQQSKNALTYPTLWRSIPASSDSMVYDAPEFSDPLLGDSQLTQLAETVVWLGGKHQDGASRWRFACILEPLDSKAPPHLHELVVRAQSSESPHRPGVTRAPTNPSFALSTHAYQSGVSVYRARLVEGDQAIAFDNIEHARSAIALPIEGLDGAVVGALYVVGEDEGAFDQHDQLLLRIMSRIIGELLVAYRVRRLSRENITAMITHPEAINPAVEFNADADFVRDVERQVALLAASSPGEADSSAAATSARSLSFLAVDMNDQGRVIASYGEEISQLLMLAVGRRIKEQVRLLLNQSDQFALYRIFADRFFIMLRDVKADEIYNYGYQLREALGGSYHIRGNVTIEHVSARVAAITYDVSALRALGTDQAQRDAAPDPTRVRINVTRTLDEALTMAKQRGAKGIVTWNGEQRRLVEWSPEPSTPIVAAELVARLATAPENSQEALVYKMLTNLMGGNQ